MPEQSPSQTVGPFFHFSLLSGGENILVNDQTKGEKIRIVGTVFDGDGQPIPDAMLEIWQADSQGFFNHPLDPNQKQADQNFKGFGRADTQAGTYEFVTVKPGRVPGEDNQLQAPHINVRLFARGMLIHIYTRIYFSDESANASDALLNSVDDARRWTLIAQAEPDYTYRFDIHMQGANETVFFEP
jgi:protocatechuate 3,4-dioxygenase, alpha subunit